MDIKYYEVFFGGYSTEQFSMCIRGVRRPSADEANVFLSWEVDHCAGGKPVSEVYEIDRTEAESLYDFSNEENWPVFGMEV